MSIDPTRDPSSPEFDRTLALARWRVLPVAFGLIEFHGDGDPAFGGNADDRAILTTGRVAERTRLGQPPAAEFADLESALAAAQAIPNRRPGSILGLVPRWR